ncbi:MAG: Non-homologous end joining protein Ku [Nitrospirae bacterium]|nr:MAG: putative DNA repair protein YkoV [Nitrospira sp. OLB3]MBV6469558.1 Non-homologous end joining protein Ku [Nitrospirota bacterium]MCE7965352.1 Ku protein [Nitrospira sp. NTP2]MCK6493428.1 Ku protein [Nitrospira sp.]MEB2338926.1 Ku protein [Nitrospirales bacterium]
MERPLWRGSISFGLVNIPVLLYSAEDHNRFDLTLLDRRDMKPVGFKRYNKTTGKEVGWDQIVKGYEYDKDRYVVLTDEDFRRANVEATQTVDIVSFIKAGDIAPASFETPYYLVPDKRGEKGYALLRETLKKTGKVAIATVVIRTRQSLAALIPWEGVLLLNTLRYAHEIRPVKDLDLPAKRVKGGGVTAREVDMATRLVEDMSESWRPERYKDTYHDDLMRLINKRIKAGRTAVVTRPSAGGLASKSSKGKVVDLMALLKQSVRHAGKTKRASASQDRQLRRKSA